MAIQNRRGAYPDFDPAKLKPGEFAVVLSGDTTATDGRALYICTSAGNVKRIATLEELKNIQYEIQRTTDETREAAARAATIAQENAQASQKDRDTILANTAQINALVEAYAALQNLEALYPEAVEFNGVLVGTIDTGRGVKQDLDNSTQAARNSDSAIKTSTTAANTAKTNLDSSIATAAATDTALKGTTKTANDSKLAADNTKRELDTSIQDARDLKAEMEGLLEETSSIRYQHPQYDPHALGWYKVQINAEGHVIAVQSMTAASSADAGLMAAADKAKLDGISPGANAYTHPSYTSQNSGLYKITVDGSGHVSAATSATASDMRTLIGSASQSTAGLLSAGDKKILDDLKTWKDSVVAGTSNVVIEPE